MIYQCLIYLVILITCNLCQDYWEDDFDEDKNCEDEELIQKLMREENPPRCANKRIGEESHQWEECKKDLSTKLVEYCGVENIEKTGDLLYCKSRGKTACCYHNESCLETSNYKHDRMFYNSVKFLSNPKEFLADMVKNLNYDTCHAITNYDANKCANDCKQLEREDFAKECAKNGGLFKCCIRRDKEFCHECRFCCTLSVCTSHKGTVYKGSKDLISHKNNFQNVNSKIGFETDHKMWKAYDFRCLKPKANKKPEEWPHYEMNGYRNAKTRHELESVQEIKFDKYFFNLEDPLIFIEMVNGTRKENIWKKTYGFDFVSFNDKKLNSGNINNMHPNMELPCNIYCLKSEGRQFAKNCKKKGGLFKCCMSILSVEKFEGLRWILIKQWELMQGAYTDICGYEPDIGINAAATNCALCAITQICAVKNPFTGKVEETFKKPYTNPQHKIGGRNTGHGLKYWACHVQETCKGHDLGDHGEAKNFPQADFQRASSQEEFCNLTQYSKNTGIKKRKRKEPFQTRYYEECMKQNSPNLLICPDIEHLRQSNDVAYVTNILWNLRNDMRRKLKKKKYKSSTMKKKRKGRKSWKKKKGSKQSSKTQKNKKQNRKQKRRRGLKSRKKYKVPKNSKGKK